MCPLCCMDIFIRLGYQWHIVRNVHKYKVGSALSGKVKESASA
jgi:hypothetical protein